MATLLLAAHIEAMSVQKPTSDAASNEAGTDAPLTPPRAGSSHEGLTAPSGPASSEPTGPGTSETATEAIIGDFISTDFGVHKSIRYHTKRRAFLDTWHRLSMLAGVTGGSAAFFALVGDNTEIGKFAALAVFVATSVDMIFAFPEKAREHDKLSERFSDLAIELSSIDIRNIDRKQIAELKIRRLNLEKIEPTSLDALNVICHNEEAEARGYENNQIYKVGWLQRMVAQFFTFPWFSPEPLGKDDHAVA